MKIAVNTPTGNIGNALTQHLLDAEADVILLVRNPEKVKAFAERGAEVHQGTLADKDFVVEATQGVDALFWVTPGDYTSDDFRATQKRMGENAAAAVVANKIPRVVDLSSVGAHHSGGTGPIAGLYDVEKTLEKTGAHVTHLRPHYFMENLFMSAGSIAAANAFYLPVKGELRMPWVATADIAKVAAGRLLDTAWTGRSVMELVGPEEVSFDEAAETVGRVLGKKVAHVTVTDEQALEGMAGMGINRGAADLFIEMYGAFASGKVKPESAKILVGETRLDTFVEKVFRPGFEAMSR
jgi:uncharacterized protein YbjT (DUF2867 family)